MVTGLKISPNMAATRLAGAISMNSRQPFLILLTVLAVLLNVAVAYLIYTAMVLDAQNIADHVMTPDQRTITNNVIAAAILALALQSASFVFVFKRYISWTRNERGQKNFHRNIAKG